MMKLDDDYLGLTAGIAHEVKSDSYRLLELSSGNAHLEVGSGSGHDSVALAERFPDCRIMGIDLYADIVKVANERAAEMGLANVTHLTGDAAQYEFEAPFDSMRAERVFQHLQDEEIAKLVNHLAGYAKAGSIFCLVGIDWETLSVTVPPRHRKTFRMMKDHLIEISNVNFVYSAMQAFDNAGYDLEYTDTYDFRVNDFQLAFTVFNLANIADHLALDSERMRAMREDFQDGKHYFTVGGCTLSFRKR